MPLQLAKRRAIYGAIEDSDSYGVAEAVAAADAVETAGVTVTPAEVAGEDKVFDRNYFGAYAAIPVNTNAMVNFGVYLAGTGTANTSPRWARFLRACAMRVGDINPGGATVSLANNQRDPLRGVDKGAEGEVRVSKKGRVFQCLLGRWLEYPDRAFTPDASKLSSSIGFPESPANGLQVVQVSPARGVVGVYERTRGKWTLISRLDDLVFTRSPIWTPVSDGFASATVRAEYQDVLHTLAGARGDYQLEIASGSLPRATFDLRGLYRDSVARTAGNAITPAYAAEAEVVGVNAGNTKAWLMGREFVMVGMSFQSGNQISYINNPGFEEVIVADHLATGTVRLQLDSELDPNFVALAKTGASGFLRVKHGAKAGARVELVVPEAQLNTVSYGEADGRHTVEVNFNAQPLAGGDDYAIIFS